MLTANLTRADGLIYRLPADGTWATYLLESTSSVKGEVLERVKTNIRIASAGEVTKNGHECRWIEVVTHARKESRHDGPEGETRVREYDKKYRLLIPEKYLAKGEAPLDHVIGGHGSLRALASLLYGPLKDAKPLPKEAVENKKLGKLLCEGVAGSLDIADPVAGTTHMKLEDRLHPSSPFGLVSSQCVFEMPLRRKVGNIQKGIVRVEWILNLTDYGTGARSEMPNVK
jgi:hypothetical protein